MSTQVKIIQYLQMHPYSRCGDVAVALGITRTRMHGILVEMERSGMVSRTAAGDGNRRLGKYVYSAIRSPIGQDNILVRARHIGHPFGILAAQVMA